VVNSNKVTVLWKFLARIETALPQLTHGTENVRRYRGIFVLFGLFVIIKFQNPYFASRSGVEVKPLGVYPLGPRSSSCVPTKGIGVLFVCL